MHQEETHWTEAGKASALRQRELREAIAMAMASLASCPDDGDGARDACRRIETAVLASDAGPLGLSLLETLDARLREALGEHDLLEGRYA